MHIEKSDRYVFMLVFVWEPLTLNSYTVVNYPCSYRDLVKIYHCTGVMFIEVTSPLWRFVTSQKSLKGKGTVSGDQSLSKKS